MQLDLGFPAFAQSATAEAHRYRLYAGLPKDLSLAHSQEVKHAHRTAGRQIGKRMLQLKPDGAVQIRPPEGRVRNGGAMAGNDARRCTRSETRFATHDSSETRIRSAIPRRIVMDLTARNGPPVLRRDGMDLTTLGHNSSNSTSLVV